MDRRPLKKGTLIDYCGEIAEVLYDDGGDRIEVVIDGSIQSWYWRFEGVECKVVDVEPDYQI